MLDQTTRWSVFRELTRTERAPDGRLPSPDGCGSGTIAALRAALAGNDSTTATLERWCAVQGIACPGGLVARRLPGPARPPGRLRRQRLRLRAHERLRYRRVLLRCGTLVLCEAENWYVPERLPAWMNRLLDRTTIPFGRVVAPLGFRRHPLSVQVLRVQAGAIGRHAVLQQQAMLTRADGLPFCEVVERFTDALLVGQRRDDAPPGRDAAAGT